MLQYMLLKWTKKNTQYIVNECVGVIGLVISWPWFFLCSCSCSNSMSLHPSFGNISFSLYLSLRLSLFLILIDSSVNTPFLLVLHCKEVVCCVLSRLRAILLQLDIRSRTRHIVTVLCFSVIVLCYFFSAYMWKFISFRVSRS